VNGHVRADCPECGVPTTFEFMHRGGQEFGQIVIETNFQREQRVYNRVFYKLGVRGSASAAFTMASIRSRMRTV
jgi:hypothetical protein